MLGGIIMWEKLLVAIGLTFALHLCLQTGLFNLSQTTQESIDSHTLFFVAKQNDN